MDTRLEFEFGVTDSVQSALYFNLSAVSQQVDEAIVNSWKMPSVSSEWKFKLLDPVADSLGLGFYIELTGAPHEFEVEGKFLADKHLGPVLIAFNAVIESESEVEPEELETELTLEFDLGVAWLLHENFSLASAMRHVSIRPRLHPSTELARYVRALASASLVAFCLYGCGPGAIPAPTAEDQDRASER